uniref:Uncharacterized protein n=1 Tax=Sinocyclocheilus grahami TaxID=75366 RepID=A0A672SHX6_SINGR
QPLHCMFPSTLAVLLFSSKEPLFLDLIGTCHSEQLKPAVLTPRHLSIYRMNLLRGLTCYPPDILSSLLDEHKLKLDDSGALLIQEVCICPSAFPLEEYFHVNSAPEVETELDNTSNPSRFPTPHVTVQPSELLFYDGPASKSVSITNHTKGKICLIWTHGAESPYSISPLSCELGPLKSTAFRVTYSPNQQNVFHAAQLECLTFYKVILDPEECPSACVLPPSGLVPSGSHQILTFRCAPSPDHPASIPLTLHLNASPKHTQVNTMSYMAVRL